MWEIHQQKDLPRLFSPSRQSRECCTWHPGEQLEKLIGVENSYGIVCFPGFNLFGFYLGLFEHRIPPTSDGLSCIVLLK